MAFIQYLTFDGTALPLPDSYEVQMDDVEADSGGETEAGTVQRDVVTLAGSRVGLRLLSAAGKTLSVANSSVAADFLKSLDV